MTVRSTAAREARAASSASRAVNVTLSEDLSREAKAPGLNTSQARVSGLAAAVSEARDAAWLRENQAAIEAMNDYVEKNGLPLEEFRQF